MKLYLLGTGKIEKNGEVISLSFKKAYALLYYLAIERTVSRETVVNLLWGNQSEAAAKKNLRNAVYVIRKTLGDDLILSPKRDVLSLNMDMVEYLDIDYLESLKVDELLELHDLSFLEGFHVKDAEYFDEWISNQKYHIKEKLTRRMKTLVNEALDSGDAVSAENLCRKLLTFDAFDEAVYRMLFYALRDQDKYTSIVSTYNELSELLNNELMLVPDDETKQVFESIMMEKSPNPLEDKVNIYGRVEEINVLRAGLNSHIRSKSRNSYMLYGEFGIGKSTIMNTFYNETASDYTVFMGRCYKAEMDFLLSPWFAMLDEIAREVQALHDEVSVACIETVETILNSNKVVLDESDSQVTFNSYVLEKAIVDMMNCLLTHRTVILMFEDIQWMDKLSLKILTRLMKKDILVILTANTDYYPVEHYMDLLSGAGRVIKLEIKPFSKLETFELIHMLKSNEAMHFEVLDQIYSESGGNPLYIAEILNAYETLDDKRPYSGKIDDVMQSRFRMLNRDEQKILNIASNFYDYFSYEDIKSISGMDEFVLLDVLSQLVKKKMLTEVSRGNNVFFTFSHHAFRECVYNDLPLSVRRVYHGKIGQYLEKTSGENPTLNRLYRLLYNFSSADNPIKELTYRIKFVLDYFNFAHEMFPVLGKRQKDDMEYSDLIDLSGIHAELGKIEELFNRVEGELKDHLTLRFDYHRLIGRYYNIIGELNRAITHMDEMLILSKERNVPADIFNALLQRIYYFINTRDVNHLLASIDEAFGVVSDNKGKQGILLRLQGYAYILEGHFDKGIATLEMAIEILENLENKDPYLLNIVGAYYYKGEGFRFKEKFEQAMEAYEVAVDLCEKNGYKNKLAFMYGSMGQAFYEMGDYKHSERYLKKAKELYDLLEGAWGRSITLGYYGLILMRNKRYTETLSMFMEIDQIKALEYNPYHNALIQRIKAETCYYLRDNDLKNELFEYINCKNESYCEIAIDDLSKFNSTYEVRLLAKMNALCSKCRTEN